MTRPTECPTEWYSHAVRQSRWAMPTLRIHRVAPARAGAASPMGDLENPQNNLAAADRLVNHRCEVVYGDA